jgi:hypothetical protein
MNFGVSKGIALAVKPRKTLDFDQPETKKFDGKFNDTKTGNPQFNG